MLRLIFLMHYFSIYRLNIFEITFLHSKKQKLNIQQHCTTLLSLCTINFFKKNCFSQYFARTNYYVQFYIFTFHLLLLKKNIFRQKFYVLNLHKRAKKKKKKTEYNSIRPSKFLLSNSSSLNLT